MIKIKQSIYLSWIFCTTLCFSCRTHSEKLNDALKLSGKNRQELEKVLKHYSQDRADSLKRKAAIFLIENMPGHFSYNGPYLREFKNIVDTLPDSYWLKKIILMQPYRYKEYREQLQEEEDIKHIKADYLIHNIDAAFKMLETKPWLESLPFEDFCEYLLPYRIDNELLDNWKDSIIPIYENKITEKTTYCDDQRYSAFQLAKETSIEFYSSEQASSDMIAGIPYQKYECINDSRLRVIATRKVGIPCTIDFVPAWADMNGYHYWMVVVDPKYKTLSSYQIEGKTAPKVYRRTFSINEIPRDPKGENFIPEFFKDPFNKDVTDIYLNTSDVKVNLLFPPSRGVKYAYIAMFNDLTLKIVGWGKITRDQVTFPKLGRGIVYFPVYFSGNQLMNGNFPFILKMNGETEFLIPDTTRRQTIRITRKFPVIGYKTVYGELLKGNCFSASNTLSFKDSTIIHKITENPYMHYTTFKVDTNLKYRYWKISNTHYSHIAELVFRDAKGNYLSWKTIPQDRNRQEEYLGDNDPLTYTYIYRNLLLDFGEPVQISSVGYLSQNDGNGIYPGNEYELFFYDRNGWHSLGRKTADDHYIEYESVPAGALYWLRNHTTGREERPFTYKNGEVHFW